MNAKQSNQSTYGSLLRELDDRVRAAEAQLETARQKRLTVLSQALNEGMTLREAGEILGISRQRVDQIVKAKGETPSTATEEKRW